MEPADARTALARQVLEAYRFEFREYSEWWRDLDRKAQGTVAIGGLILTATAAVLAAPVVSGAGVEAVLAALLVSLLLGALCLSVRALLLRSVETAPTGEAVEELAREILAVGAESTDADARAPAEAELPQQVDGLVYDLGQDWQRVNQTLCAECAAKAEDVRRAQVLILAAAVAIALLAFGRLADGYLPAREGGTHEVQLQGMRSGRGAPGDPVQGPSAGREQLPDDDDAQEADAPQEDGPQEGGPAPVTPTDG